MLQKIKVRHPDLGVGGWSRLSMKLWPAQQPINETSLLDSNGIAIDKRNGLAQEGTVKPWREAALSAAVPVPYLENLVVITQACNLQFAR